LVVEARTFEDTKVIQQLSHRSNAGWINSLNSLFYLDLSNNSFTGRIPITLMEIPVLKSDKASAYLDPGHLELPVF
jgi:hypothetical protein